VVIISHSALPHMYYVCYVSTGVARICIWIHYYDTYIWNYDRTCLIWSLSFASTVIYQYWILIRCRIYKLYYWLFP